MAGEQTRAAGPAGSGSGDGLRDAARETIDTVKQEASGLADRATEQGRSMLSRQKDAAADHIDSVARALHGSARGLEGEEPAAGRYVDYAAQRLQSVGRRLRERDVDGLIDDVQDVGRRAPGAFFAGSVVAGFLMARFLKSSAERVAGPEPWRDASSTGADRGRPRGPTGPDRESDLRGRSAHPAGATAVSAGMATSSGPGTTPRPAFRASPDARLAGGGSMDTDTTGTSTLGSTGVRNDR